MLTRLHTNTDLPIDFIDLGKKKSIRFDFRPACDLAPAMKPMDLYRRNPLSFQGKSPVLLE